jgi:alpha-ketoglutaric semialdehyde dehydrogenase
VAGGHRLEGEDHQHGFFFAPTILDSVSCEAWVAQEEIFGPVLSVITARDLEQGVEMVNDSRYGLPATMFTKKLTTAHHFAENVEAGNVAVNLPTAGWRVHRPFGGFKDPGSAFKEQGREGLQFYTRVRTVAMDVSLE